MPHANALSKSVLMSIACTTPCKQVCQNFCPQASMQYKSSSWTQCIDINDSQ